MNHLFKKKSFSSFDSRFHEDDEKEAGKHLSSLLNRNMKINNGV